MEYRLFLVDSIISYNKFFNTINTIETIDLGDFINTWNVYNKYYSINKKKLMANYQNIVN